MRKKLWLAACLAAATLGAASPAGAKQHDYACKAKHETRADLAAQACEPVVGVNKGLAIIAD